jgi:hypothetical protein
MSNKHIGMPSLTSFFRIIGKSVVKVFEETHNYYTGFFGFAAVFFFGNFAVAVATAVSAIFFAINLSEV